MYYVIDGTTELATWGLVECPPRSLHLVRQGVVIDVRVWNTKGGTYARGIREGARRKLPGHREV